MRPTESTISPLKTRDVLPDSRQLHEHVFVYTIQVPEGTHEITPKLSRFNDVLYDSAFENVYGICKSHFYIGFNDAVYDSNKKILSHQDIYPKSVKLKEGTYTYRVQVIGKSITELKSLKNMTLIIDEKVAKPISLPIYKTLESCLYGKDPGSIKVLEKSQKACLFVGDNAEAITKEMKPGDLLLGSVDMVKKEKLKLCDVAYLVPSEVKPEKESTFNFWTEDASNVKPEAPESETMTEAIKNYEIAYIPKLKDEKYKKQVIDTLLEKYPESFDLVLQKLTLLSSGLEENYEFHKPAKEMTPEKLKSAQEIATSMYDYTVAILKRIDQQDLAVYFARNHDPKNEIEKKEKDLVKKTLVQCFKSQLHSLAVSHELSLVTGKDASSINSENLASFDKVSNSVSEWSATPAKNDALFIQLWSWRQAARGNYGLAMKVLVQFMPTVLNAPKQLKKLNDYRVFILQKLEWGVWSKYEYETGLISYPKDFAPF